LRENSVGDRLFGSGHLSDRTTSKLSCGQKLDGHSERKLRGSVLHDRTSRTSPHEIISTSRIPQKKQRAARHNYFSVRFRSISLCEEQLADNFRRPRENRKNHDIFKFAASVPIAQKQLKKPDGAT
jgi:hypothetical protein